MTKAALEGLGLAFGVTESLIVEVESEVIDSMGSRGPEGSVASRTPWGVVASQALPRSVASATGPAVVAHLEQHHIHPKVYWHHWCTCAEWKE